MIVGWEVDKVKANDVVGLLMVPVIEEKPKVEEVVTRENERPPLVGGERQIRLVPGYNEIPDEDWEKIKVHLTDKILDKRITYFAKRKKNEETGEFFEESIAITDITPLEKAKEIILNCYDLATLNYWISPMPDTKELHRVISVQIKGIKDGKTPDERKDILKGKR